MEADFLVVVPRAEEEGEEALVSISFPKRGSAVADFLETPVGFLGALAPIAQELKRSRLTSKQRKTKKPLRSDLAGTSPSAKPQKTFEVGELTE